MGDIENILKQSPFFKNWDADTIEECNRGCKLKAFKPDETILGDEVGGSNYVFFIIKGTCSIIELLKVKVYEINKKRKFKIFDPAKDEESNSKYRVQIHLIQICELRQGSCFNVGEKFINRRVVAKTSMNCLLIPLYLVWKNNKDHTWTRVQKFLNNHVPATKEIFKTFCEQDKFIRYKKELLKDILAQTKKPRDNLANNIPYSYRLREKIMNPFEI